MGCVRMNPKYQEWVLIQQSLRRAHYLLITSAIENNKTKQCIKEYTYSRQRHLFTHAVEYWFIFQYTTDLTKSIIDICNSNANINVGDFDHVFVEWNSAPNVNDKSDISRWLYHPYVHQRHNWCELPNMLT